jgi:dihydroorotate dehydrogenase
VPAWSALGFGFSELGGVTWHAQPGNPAPRMFRAVRDEALVNRMGFNNPGAEALAATLAGWRRLGRWPAHPVWHQPGQVEDHAPRRRRRGLRELLPRPARSRGISSSST